MPRHSALRTEQEHHRKAFEIYFAQGGRRSHERVAKELGVAVATVKSWSRHFAWAKRLAEREATVARQVADQALQSTVDEVGRNKKIVQMALIKVAKAINAEKVKVQVGDLDRLIRLQTFLEGGYAPVTLDMLSRMQPQEVYSLLEKWLDSLSLEVLDSLRDRSETANAGSNPTDAKQASAEGVAP